MGKAKTYKEDWVKLADLGAGGQGSTIIAERIQHKKPAVIKILHSQNDRERRARMHRETASLSTLFHESIPQILDSNTEYWEDKNYKLFIATELIPGSNLSYELFKNESLAAKINLTKKLSEIVKYFHSAGIVHRDIKPDNIILKNNSIEDQFIIDFGLSFNFNENDNDNLTPNFQQLGNRFLLLPEQKVGEAGKRDMRSDVTYLVGIFYYVMIGEEPTVLSDGQNAMPHQRAKAKEIINLFPRHQRDLINQIFDIGFNSLIDRRFQTALSLINMLIMLEQSTPSELDNIDSIQKFIIKESDRDAYKEIRRINELKQSMYSTILDLSRKIITELGAGWSLDQYFFGPSRKYEDQGYRLNGKIGNELMGVGMDTFVGIFMTGSEIIIKCKVDVDDNQTLDFDIIRQPVSLELQSEFCRGVLRNRFLGLIVDKINK
ncbi:protein kinase domain-containing protein [Hymenobacter coccineus]|uniref:protein kinase domain-containing protein n=1 Tax=Hymenobacter coccineus TaxID=1908235 RepID=UPI0009F5789C|nr:protein kinase [Hymenobacter coccineus]